LVSAFGMRWGSNVLTQVQRMLSRSMSWPAPGFGRRVHIRVSYRSTTFVSLAHNSRIIAPLSTCLTVVTDSAITLVMCVLMHRKRAGLDRSILRPRCNAPLTQRRSNMFAETHSVIDRLVCHCMGARTVAHIAHDDDLCGHWADDQVRAC
jgi:hypothetical protein